jgi:hypothetical protein
MCRLTADPKVIIKSDNIYLPRLTKNGVPVYDSLRTSRAVQMYRNLEAVVPLYVMLHLHHPVGMFAAFLVFYLNIYRVRGE